MTNWHQDAGWSKVWIWKPDYSRYYHYVNLHPVWHGGADYGLLMVGCHIGSAG
jgi:hypothetical protein